LCGGGGGQRVLDWGIPSEHNTELGTITYLQTSPVCLKLSFSIEASKLFKLVVVKKSPCWKSIVVAFCRLVRRKSMEARTLCHVFGPENVCFTFAFQCYWVTP